jgi:RNA polymerase sigma-70 factor (ECF subfamily)
MTVDRFHPLSDPARAPESGSKETAVVPNRLDHLRSALLRFFRRKIGNTSEAEDLTQDVLLRALLHTNWDVPEQAKGYVFRIAVNCWRDRSRRLRAHGINIRWDEAPEEIEETGAQNSPEHVLVVREELDQVAAALEQLSVRTRTVLMLIKLEQMRIATVAEMLGISKSAVNKHLARGLAHLAEFRKRQEGL